MMKLKSFLNNKPQYGISIYPEQASVDELKEYLDKANKYGFKRVFTNLIGLSKDDLAKFKEVCDYGKKISMDMIADIDESVLKILGVELTDTSYFKNLGVKIIRMDVKFNAEDVAKLSLNKDDIHLELNASDFSGLEQELLNFEYNKSSIIASHNFFPQRYTGLSLEKFERANKQMKNVGLQVSVFTAINRDDVLGAWKDGKSPVTLEKTRDMNIYDQYQYLSAINAVDYILASNMFLSTKEFEEISKIDLSKISFRVQEEYDITENERNIIYHDAHQLRGDNPDDIMFRSTISRKIFKDLDIPPRNCVDDIMPGDIVILNNKFGRYKGELHIMKSQIKNDGKRNVVGKINQTQMPLLELGRPKLYFNIKGGE